MTTEYIYGGCDLGMGATKFWGPAGGAQVLSLVSSNGMARYDDLLGASEKSAKQKPMEVRSKFGSFFVGENAHDYGEPLQNLAFDRLAGTSEIHSIFYATLTKYQQEYGKFSKPLSLMVGLPFQMLLGATSKEYKSAVKKWMVGQHEWRVDGVQYCVDVAEVFLKPQAQGIMFDYTYTIDGVMMPDRARYWVDETAGLSIGRKTIEFMLTRDNGDIDRFTGGIEMGVTRLLEDLNRRYEVQLNCEKPYTLGELDMKLRNKRIEKAMLGMALDDYSQRVSGAIEDRWGKYYKRFAAVLVVGGGAELLKGYMPQMLSGKAIVLDEPVMAISRGLYKMALKFKDKTNGKTKEQNS